MADHSDNTTFEGRLQNPTAIPSPGARLTAAEVDATIGHAPSQAVERAGQPRNPTQPAGAESAALRVQNSGDGQGSGEDFAGGDDETRAEVESVISRNPG